MKHIVAVMTLEAKLVTSDPFPIVVLIAMPLVLIAFLSSGLAGGPGQAVPGLIVLFGFLGLFNVGMAFFRDHGWRTWGRLRTSPIPTWQLVAGKTIPQLGLLFGQNVLLLGVGFFLFGMPMNGSPLALVAVILLVILTEVAFGLVLVSFCKTINQVSAFSNLGGILLAGIGGALSPVSTFPEWAQHLAPISPVYWVLEALRGVIAGKPLSELTPAVVVLTSMTVVCFGLALSRFNMAEEKEYFA